MFNQTSTIMLLKLSSYEKKLIFHNGKKFFTFYTECKYYDEAIYKFKQKSYSHIYFHVSAYLIDRYKWNVHALVID